MFTGHDGRWLLEQNVGYLELGEQDSSWLYQQTKQLHDAGVLLTYSGDQPFLNRLLIGTSVDHMESEENPSKLQMYLGNDDSVKPETVHEKSGHRGDVRLPFRTTIPHESLTFLPDIRCVCPDGTHAITRCVEGDIRKFMELKILQSEDDSATVDFIRENFQRNLTERGWKEPGFEFDIDKRNKKCAPISLSGREAITGIADMYELAEAGVQHELFEGVFSENKTVGALSGTKSASMNVLKNLHPNSFENIESPCQMKLLVAAELWRKSLNQLTVLMRTRKKFEEQDFSDYKYWSEIHYHISIVLFDVKLGLTPYRLKLCLIPQLLEGGYIESPFNHLCEGPEKSNHHVHRDFQQKTMRGGGTVRHADPMFLEMFFTFCSGLRFSTLEGTIDEQLSLCHQRLFNEPIEVNLSFLDSLGPTEKAIIPVGKVREKSRLFLGKDFFCTYMPTSNFFGYET